MGTFNIGPCECCGGGDCADNASFTATPRPDEECRTVDFQVTGVPPECSCTYSWDFGDGGMGSGDSPSHTYDCEDGTSFDVTLTVDCTDGTDNEIGPAQVIVCGCTCSCLADATALDLTLSNIPHCIFNESGFSFCCNCTVDCECEASMDLLNGGWSLPVLPGATNFGAGFRINFITTSGDPDDRGFGPVQVADCGFGFHPLSVYITHLTAGVACNHSLGYQRLSLTSVSIGIQAFDKDGVPRSPSECVPPGNSCQGGLPGLTPTQYATVCGGTMISEGTFVDVCGATPITATGEVL